MKEQVKETKIVEKSGVLIGVTGGVRHILPHEKDFPASQLTDKYEIPDADFSWNWC